MKKVLYIIIDKLKLLGIALGIFAIFIGVVWFIGSAPLREAERQNKADPVYQKVMAEIAEKDKADKERQKKLDKLDAEKQEKEKAKADFEESIKGKYTKEYLSKKIVTDRKMAERLVSMGGYDCMNYWYASHNWDDELCYDELSYYVFKDKKSAQIAFESMKESWIEAETDSGKNYIQGWEKDVMDAEVETFIYHTDNMIITAELQVVSGWAEPVDGEDGEDGNSTVGFFYRKDFIMDNF